MSEIYLLVLKILQIFDEIRNTTILQINTSVYLSLVPNKKGILTKILLYISIEHTQQFYFI